MMMMKLYPLSQPSRHCLEWKNTVAASMNSLPFSSFLSFAALCSQLKANFVTISGEVVKPWTFCPGTGVPG